MGNPKAPPDNSAEVARIEAEAAEKARFAEQQRKQEERIAFENRLNSSHNNAIQEALSYFEGRGVDPDEYVDEIGQRANSIRGTVPDLDSAPGSYYNNLGQLVYDAEQGSYRSGKMRDLDRIAPAGFDTRRIADTSDDAYIAAILEERQNKAEGYVRNLLDRGVITTAGFNAAQGDLKRQRSGANMQLNELGIMELERGRGRVRNIANEGRQTANALDLGQMFDPYEYEGRLNNEFMDFFTGLGDRMRAVAPEDLFDTAGLAGIAGASQGAGNTAFNPNAIAGNEDEDEDEDELDTNPF